MACTARRHGTERRVRWAASDASYIAHHDAALAPPDEQQVLAAAGEQIWAAMEFGHAGAAAAAAALIWLQSVQHCRSACPAAVR